MECPQIYPDKCDGGREMVLKFRKADRSPFYVCECKPAHFKNPKAEWTTPATGGGAESGGRRIKSVNATVQFCCVECGAINEVETVTHLIDKAPQRQAQGGGRVDNEAYPPGLDGEKDSTTPDDRKPTQQPNRGYNRY